MLRKGLLLALLGSALSISAVAADVVIRVGPPRPLVERRGPPPGRGYIWTNGYHRWDGSRYVWAPGAWVMPPRPRAHWVPAHYAHRHGGWVFIEGHWR